MKKKRILITAGPTREKIDPVRFVSNFSTGEMGYEIASEARKAGYQVTLLSGPTSLKPPKDVSVIPFESTADLSEKLVREFKKTDVLVMAAAVSDYVPVKAGKEKIKRKSSKLTIQFKATPDLLKKVSRIKKRQKVVGFCLETSDLFKKAEKKLKGKKLDYVVGNFISPAHDPFGAGKTSVLILNKQGERIWLENIDKKKIARFLVREVC